MIKFGTAGLDKNFEQQGFKKTIQVPTYLHNMGLDAFEYQCGRGVNIGFDKAEKLGQLAKQKEIGRAHV